MFTASFKCWKGWEYYTQFIDFVKLHPHTHIVVELPEDFLRYDYIYNSHYASFFATNIHKNKPSPRNLRWTFISFARYYQLKDLDMMYSSDTDKFLIYCKEEENSLDTKIKN